MVEEMTLGQRFKLAREHAEMDHIGLLLIFGFPRAHMREIEADERNPYLLESSARWAEIYGVNEEWLTTGKGEMVS